jgi:hypothetical protein
MPHKLTLRKDWPLLHDILKDELPHGSGIDADWNIHPAAGHGIACSNSYHAMDCMGSYVDWLDFTVYYGWNAEQQQFEFKKLVADRHAVWMVDEEGDRYNDREGIVDYLNDCFPNEIHLPPPPTMQQIVAQLTVGYLTAKLRDDGLIAVTADIPPNAGSVAGWIQSNLMQWPSQDLYPLSFRCVEAVGDTEFDQRCQATMVIEIIREWEVPNA